MLCFDHPSSILEVSHREDCNLNHSVSCVAVPLRQHDDCCEPGDISVLQPSAGSFASHSDEIYLVYYQACSRNEVQMV